MRECRNLLIFDCFMRGCNSSVGQIVPTGAACAAHRPAFAVATSRVTLASERVRWDESGIAVVRCCCSFTLLLFLTHSRPRYASAGRGGRWLGRRGRVRGWNVIAGCTPSSCAACASTHPAAASARAVVGFSCRERGSVSESSNVGRV